MFDFRYTSGVCKKTILSFRMGQKKLLNKLVISSNIDGFYRYISQGGVAMQLRCGDIFSNCFISNFPQNVPVKNN